MIFRTVKDRDNRYVRLNTAAANDPRLSFKAIGIHTYIMSKPDGWEAREADMVQRHTDGLASVRSGVKELIEFGYMVRVRERDEHGRTVGWRIDTYETPDLNPLFNGKTSVSEPEFENRNVDSPECDFPHVENPQVENPQVENRTNSNNRSNPLLKKETNEGSSRAAAATDGHSAVFTCWAENMSGTMTPILADQITELVNEHGHADVLRAIGIAVERNKRNLGYVRGILNRGIDSKPPAPAGNGYHNGNGAPLSKVERSLQAVDNVERMMREQGLIQ